MPIKQVREVLAIGHNGPQALIAGIEIPQRSSLLPQLRCANLFCRKHGRHRAVKRRNFITLLGGAAAWPLAARAQQVERIWRVGLLETTTAESNVANLAALKQALLDLGYVEGRNLAIEYRSAEGRPERFEQLAAELVRMNTDVILARGTPAALAAKKANQSIPVVVTASAQPFTFVDSLAHPGGNITGLSSLVSDLYAKREPSPDRGPVRMRREEWLAARSPRREPRDFGPSLFEVVQLAVDLVEKDVRYTQAYGEIL